MNNAGGVQVLDAAQHLVEEVRHTLVIQIHLDHLTQIRVHELHHQVHILKLVQRPLRRERVQKTDYLQDNVRDKIGGKRDNSARSRGPVFENCGELYGYCKSNFIPPPFFPRELLLNNSQTFKLVSLETVPLIVSYLRWK